MEDNNITPEMAKRYGSLYDNPIRRTIMLCNVKSSNIYSEETGFYVDRMAYMFYEPASYVGARKTILQNCVDEHKDLSSHAEIAFYTVKCVLDMDDKERSNLIKN